MSGCALRAVHSDAWRSLPCGAASNQSGRHLRRKPECQRRTNYPLQLTNRSHKLWRVRHFHGSAATGHWRRRTVTAQPAANHCLHAVAPLPGTMFQPAPKRCFTIESLVAKDSPHPASRSEDPIRPAALSYANSSPMNPFLNGFHSTGRGVYSNPDLMFAETVSHPPNPAVPVHPVPPPHALAAHPLPTSHSPHPLFASQQRDPSTFYPWLIHRYRYLGHRFQGKCWTPL